MILTSKQNRFVIDAQKDQTPAAFENLYSKQHVAAAGNVKFYLATKRKIQQSENATER